MKFMQNNFDWIQFYLVSYFESYQSVTENSSSKNILEEVNNPL